MEEIMKHENWYNEEYMHARRKDVVEVASALISGQIHFLEGVRALTSLCHEVTGLDFDEDFSIFVAIDSETDHLPSEKVRHRFSEAWLEKADKEVCEIKESYNTQVVEACQKLVARFGRHA